MKKTLFAIISTVTLLFTGCFSPVFYDIEQDVYPEKATISGVITNIARYNANGKEFFICAADQGIRYKPVSSEEHTEWYVYNNLPFNLVSYNFDDNTMDGEQILKIVTDSDYVYMITTTYAIDDESGNTYPDVQKIYAKKITLNSNGLLNEEGNWTNVAPLLVPGTTRLLFPFFFDSDGKYNTEFNIFSTNSPKNNHRAAFIRSGDPSSPSEENKRVYYLRLNGLHEPTIINLTPFDSGRADLPLNNCVNSAAYYHNTLYFFNAQAVTTNETYTSDATLIYFNKDEKLYYTDITTTTKAIDNCGNFISCLSYTKDSLLIGRGDFKAEASNLSGGITKTSLYNGIPGTALVDFTTNAAIQLSSSYVICTLIAADPSKTETEGTLYSSISFPGSSSTSNSIGGNYENIGMWSYYPSRGNWNRE